MAQDLLAADGVQHMPVVRRNGEVIGLVSGLHILEWLATQAGHMG